MSEVNLKAKKPKPADKKNEPAPPGSIFPNLDNNIKKKIAGLLLILNGIFLFISFCSYLFTWQDDSDKIFSFFNIFNEDVLPIKNLMGFLGAYLANFFFVSSFGLSSFILTWLSFIFGMHLVKPLKKFNGFKLLFNVILLLFSSSILFSLLFSQFSFPLSGHFANFIKSGLVKFTGVIGTVGILLFVLLLQILLNFSLHDILSIFKKSPSAAISNQTELKENEPLSTADFSNNEKKINTSTASQNSINSYSPISATIAKDSTNQNIISNLPNNNNIQEIVEDSSVLLINPESENNFEFQLIDKNNTDNENITLLVPNKNTTSSTSLPNSNKTIDSSKSFTLEIKDETIKNLNNPLLENNLSAKFNQEKKNEIAFELIDYNFPEIDLLELNNSEKPNTSAEELELYKNQIINTLLNYDIQIQRISATIGPTVTLFEIIPAPGIRISKIKNLEDDIALSLSALGIRIIAPIPGKGTIGIEVPNIKKTIVGLRTLLSSEKFINTNFSLPIALGKKINNENYIVDLTTMPHLLMAGATGQGKSVGINTILVSLLYKKHPSQLKFVLVDPKKVELSLYKTIEMHFLAKLPGEEEAIITDTKKVVNTLNALCIEMDNRYDLLKAAGCRNIKEYNGKFLEKKLDSIDGHQYLPFIVLVVDEFADLIMTAGKEIEVPIARLAQLARAIGIHLIIATQRPSVNIITGTIKANFPARIAFKVSSKVDSRTILDLGGAEQLIGRGDMLINYNGDLSRVQCALVDTPEVERICDFIGQQMGYPQPFYLPEYIDEKELSNEKFVDLQTKDSLFEEAARLIVQIQLGSTSSIQRKMKLGYNRAGRIMDQLEMAGIVGPSQGSKPREVKIKTEFDLNDLLAKL